jgi:uncharacterized protein YfaS (alpha-2-macroglobulin family)
MEATPMNRIWKPVALMSLAAVAILSVALLWLGVRGSTATTLLQRNVVDQVRFHLEHHEADRAASVLEASTVHLNDAALENGLRLEIAGLATPELGSRLLDGLVLAAMDRAQAALAAQARVEIQRKLFEGIALEEGALPAPFEPRAFRKSKTPGPSVEAVHNVTDKLLAAIAERRDLARRAGENPGPELVRLEAAATAVRYALGEVPFDAVPLPDDESRVRFGDLLYRERQFDRAIEIWKPVLGDPRVARKISEVAALRRYAPKFLSLWDYDLDRLPARDPKMDAEVSASVQALFKSALPGRLTAATEESPVIFDPSASRDIAPAVDPQQLYLLVEHRSFELHIAFDRPFLTQAPPEATLRTAYTGPFRFRLFKVRDLKTLGALDAATLATRRSDLEPLRDWQQQFFPLGPNGGPDREWRLEVPACPAGLYVLMADARYCPVYAFARFIVTDVGLLQQPALDRVLVYAVDRLSGAPVPDLPVEGEVSGHRVLESSDYFPGDDSNVPEFRRGFEAGWAGQPAEPEATPSYERGRGRATTFRQENPDVKIQFQGKTDRDGLFDWTVAPAWREHYVYGIRTASVAGGMSTHVESQYLTGNAAKAQRTIAYTDRPAYHPGDKVSFKAILRLRDDEGLQPYEAADAFVEIGTVGRTFLARSFPVTGFGTISGEFDLPEECPCTEYWIRINNGFQPRLFTVADYRKPDAEIVVAAPATLRAGETVDVSIHARRYSGEPLARVRVFVSLGSSSAPTTIREEDSTFPREQPREWRTLEEREFTTDDDGRCVYRFKTDPGLAATYTVLARAEREFLPPILGEAGVDVSTRARIVQVETDRPIYYPGETAKLRFRIPGATLARIEERGKTEPRFLLNVPLVDGAGTCDYPVTGANLHLSIGVRDGEEWAWTPIPLMIRPRVNARDLVGLRLDHVSYRTGETARVEITSTEPDASVLFLVATGKIHRRQVVRLVDRKAEIDIPVRDEDIPNVHLVALSVKNDRVGKATAELLVPPVDKFLTIEVKTDLPEYRPGQDCRVTVRALDRQGRPVPDCELSLGVVDDSVYSLYGDTTPDLREYFHRYQRPLRVQESFFYKESLPPFTIWKCPVFVRGQSSLYDTMGVGAGGGGGGRYGGRMGGRENLVARGGGSTATQGGRIRQEFRDTAFWAAHLVTGADGSATASFTFPDNLTRFRFTARGITRAHQVGEIRQETLVRKPFFVSLSVPRTFQEGNEISIAGIIHNHSDQPQTVRSFLRSPFPAVAPSGTVTLAPGASAHVEVRLSVDRYLPQAEIEFRAEADSGQSDGVRLQVPGARRGSPHVEGRSGSVAGGAAREEVFRIPEGAIEDSLRLTLDVDAGLHSAIAGALDPLIDYPYGCVEQTMSRFLPAVAARRALGDLPPRLKARLPAVLAAGLQRLYTLQKDDGSWGWWSSDRSDAGLTAYVLYGLALCKKAGVGVDRSVADRAVQSLLRSLQLQSFEGEWVRQGLLPMKLPVHERLFHLLAIAEYESAWDLKTESLRRLISSLSDRPERLNQADAVVLALAATRHGMTREAEFLARIAEKNAPSDVPTASFLLQLQAARGGDVAPSIRYLLSHRSGRGWSNTMESACAILGLAAALERPTPAMDAAPGRVVVAINGAPVQELTLRSGADASFDGRVTIPAPAGGWKDKAVVRLTFDGQGSAFYTASLEAMVAAAGRPPVSQGFKVTREYYERGDDGWRPLDGPIRAGRLVLVVLTIDAAANRPYVMITDPRADGFEPVETERPLRDLKFTVHDRLSDQVDLRDGWENRLEEFRRTVRGDAARETAWGLRLLREILEKRRFVPIVREQMVDLSGLIPPDRVEHRNDRSIFFVSSSVGFGDKIAYIARAELPGSFHALPPRVEAMYEPELRGSGLETSLEVADAQAPPSSRRSLDLAPGVAGLIDVLPHLGTIEVDDLLARVPAQPRIGALMSSVCGEPAMRAWLSTRRATAAAGSDLTERLAAARIDLATRHLAVDALEVQTWSWESAFRAALTDDDLARHLLQGVDPGQLESADNLLAWADEDRQFRLSMLQALQRMKSSARLQAPGLPGPGFPRVLKLLGERAPQGEGLLRWKLRQRSAFLDATLAEMAERCGRDLELKIRLLSGGETPVQAGEGRVEDALEQTLRSTNRYFSIRGGEIVVGTLEELTR